jgi:hypothetical protein
VEWFRDRPIEIFKLDFRNVKKDLCRVLFNSGSVPLSTSDQPPRGQQSPVETGCEGPFS